MNVAKRTKKLKAKVSIKQQQQCLLHAESSPQLLDIRLGPGAAVLSNGIKRIHLDFAYRIEDGHLGARNVWRRYLPRLKYHNPGISMTVTRRRDQEGPATMTLYYTSASKLASVTQSPATSTSTNTSTAPLQDSLSNRREVIDMKHKHESEILTQLMKLTDGQEYKASPDEIAELEDVMDVRKRSEMDRQAQANLNEMRMQERALLDQARGIA